MALAWASPPAAVPLGWYLLLSLVSSPCSGYLFAAAGLLLYNMPYLSVLVFVPVCASHLSQYQLLCLLCLAFFLLWHPTSVFSCVFPSGFYFPFLNFLLRRHQELLWFHLVRGGFVLSVMGTGPSLTTLYTDHPCSAPSSCPNPASWARYRVDSFGFVDAYTSTKRNLRKRRGRERVMFKSGWAFIFLFVCC